MQAIWKDGTHLIQGGTGHNTSTSSTTITNYSFDISSGWIDTLSADKRNVGATGPYLLHSGDNLCLDVAYPWARDTSNLASLQKLLLAADEIQAFYDAQNFECYEPLNNRIDRLEQVDNFVLYPNPTSGILNIRTEVKDYLVTVYNSNGAILVIEDSPKKIDLRKYSKGIYIARIVTADNVLNRKIVID